MIIKNPMITTLKYTANDDTPQALSEAAHKLVKSGLAQRAHGYNFLTKKGVEYLTNLRLLIPSL